VQESVSEEKEEDRKNKKATKPSPCSSSSINQLTCELLFTLAVSTESGPERNSSVSRASSSASVGLGADIRRRKWRGREKGKRNEREKAEGN